MRLNYGTRSPNNDRVNNHTIYTIVQSYNPYNPYNHTLHTMHIIHTIHTVHTIHTSESLTMFYFHSQRFTLTYIHIYLSQ